MNKETVFHEITSDLQSVLSSNKDVLEKWNSLTDLARNEWICYITMPKKQETKQKRLIRLQEDLLNGKRRSCCWPGCPHRNPDTAKWFK